jgi:S-adenosylmethionine decarboxylase
MKNSKAKGTHYLIDLYGCEEKQINNCRELKNILMLSVKDTEAVVLSEYFYRFSPKGVTGFLLLSASHIAIHTWPEKNHLTLDVFTCVSKEETKKIVEKILKSIKHKEKNVSFYERGFLLEKGKDF